MPYTPPGQNASSPDPTDRLKDFTDQERERDTARELQVRQTAQQLLADHLRRPPYMSYDEEQRTWASREVTFWPHISLDLTGSTLVDLNLNDMSVVRAIFTRACFLGDACFSGANFSGEANFDAATFFDGVKFDGASFSDDASFTGTRVLRLDDPDLNKGGKGARRVWPEQWIIHPDADDPRRGTLLPSALE